MKETIKKLLKKQPFEPFTIHQSNGNSFEFRHPELAMLLKSSMVVGRSDSDAFDSCALLRITNVTSNGSVS